MHLPPSLGTSRACVHRNLAHLRAALFLARQRARAGVARAPGLAFRAAASCGLRRVLCYLTCAKHTIRRSPSPSPVAVAAAQTLTLWSSASAARALLPSFPLRPHCLANCGRAAHGHDHEHGHSKAGRRGRARAQHAGAQRAPARGAPRAPCVGLGWASRGPPHLLVLSLFLLFCFFSVQTGLLLVLVLVLVLVVVLVLVG